ncbi:MAG: translocation/assembly module TamB domain-containing protein [Thermodesulfobacteriota bacterium]
MQTPQSENTQKQPAGKKRHRFILRLLLYPLALLIILLLGAFLFLQTDTARSSVKAFIRQAAARHLQVELQIEKISGSLLFDISLEQVRVSRGSEPVITAKRVSASYLLPLLLTRVLWVSEVEIDGMMLNLAREKNGRLHIAALMKAGEATSPSVSPLPGTIRINRIALSDAAVNLADHTNDPAFIRRVGNLHLAAGLKLSPDGLLTARVISLALSLDRPAFNLTGLSGRISYAPDKNRLEMKDLRARFKETDVTVNGSLDTGPAGTRFNTRTAIKTLSLPEIGQIFSIPALDRGRLAGTIQVTGTPERFHHEAELNLDGMSLSSSGEIQRTDAGSLGADISATVRHLNPAALPLENFKRLVGDINAVIRLQGSDLSRTGRQGRLAIEMKPSRISGHALSAAEIEATFGAGGIVLKDSFLAGPRGRIAVRRAEADIFDPSRPGRLQLEASLQDLDPAVSGRAELSGKLNMNIAATALLPASTDSRFDPAAITAELLADIRPSRIQSVEIDSGRIQTVWNGRDLEVKALKLSVAGGRLAISGALTPGTRNSRLQFAAELPELQSVVGLALQFFPDRAAAAGRLDLNGRLNVSGDFSGWWDRPELSAVVSGSRVKYDRVSIETFNAQGIFQGPPDDFQASVASHIERLTVNGTRFPRVDLTLQLKPESALADLSLQHEKGPALAANGRVDGWRRRIKQITIDTLRLTRPETGRGPAAAPLIEEISNSGPIRATLTPDTVEIAALKLTSKEAVLTLTGSLGAGGRIHTVLSINRLNLKRLPRFIQGQERFSGISSADVELTGTLAHPVLQARLRIADAAGFDFSFSDLDVNLNYSASRAVFSAVGYIRQHKVLELGGEAGILCSLQPFKFQPRSGEFKAAVSLRDLTLATLPIPKPAGFNYDGALTLDARIRGDLSTPEFSGNLSVKDGFFSLKGESPADVSFSDLNLAFGYDGSKAVVKAALYRHEQKALDLSGQAGLRISLYPFRLSSPDKDLKIALKARGVKLSEIPLPRKTYSNYDGLLALDLEIAGDLGAPEIVGELNLKGGFLAPPNKDPRAYAFSDLTVRFSYEAAKAAVSASLSRQNQKFLDLSGRAALELSLVPFRFKSLDKDFRMDAFVRNLKLSMLPIPRQRGIDFDALLNITATASGSLSNPVVSGSLSLQDGFLTLSRPALSYETVRLQADFSPEGMVIKELLLKGDTEGALNVKGRITAEGLKPTSFDMRLIGEDVYVPYQKSVAARVRPDLRLAGTPLKPVLTGTLTITEGRVNLDRLSTQAPAEIHVDAAGPEKNTTIYIDEDRSTTENILHPLAADVMVSVPKNAWLKGQGVNAEITGQVNLQKESGRPFVLVGPLDTARGTFDFQSKLFKITRGNIEFIGLEEPNPNLDIQAEIRIAKVKIIIKITGTAQEMALSLDSEPVMDRADIVSYLVYGRPAGELHPQQNFNAEQAALNLTGQLAANELKKILGDAFSLDVLTLEPGSGDITQGSLAIGKYVTPEVFVLYRHRFKVDEPDQVEVTYEINRNFSIETQLGNEKTSGVDLIWDFDF